jgi:hypothetical protein
MPKKWKLSKDPLFRGDQPGGVRPPTHAADKSIVRHILYLEGPGRDTPYLSCTEIEDTAKRFAGRSGKIYQTFPPAWNEENVKHRSRKELLDLLKGDGKGDAKWHDAFELAIARKYVEEHQEHLCDFSDHPSQATIVASVGKIFI